MKAFLLAAGYGTRLRPITDTVPKCLVPICGKPLLGWWFELFQKHGITDVLINTHYLPDPVRAYLTKYNATHENFMCHETFEPELLGSGGTIRKNRAFVQDEESFLICYADNLTNADLTAFQKVHAMNDGVLTMALFHTNLPKQCGIAEIGEDDRIVSFIEKPEHPKSDLANAGMYIARQELFDYLPDGDEPLDFGKSVLPKLTGRMYGWHTQGYLLDVGTLENYKKAQMDWARLSGQA